MAKKTEVIDPIGQEEAKPTDDGMLTIRCSYPIHINGKEYAGDVRVTKEVAEVLIEMLARKRDADLQVHVGRSYERHRLLDGTLVVTDAATKQLV